MLNIANMLNILYVLYVLCMLYMLNRLVFFNVSVWMMDWYGSSNGLYTQWQSHSVRKQYE
jgi:hypothetical protein